MRTNLFVAMMAGSLAVTATVAHAELPKGTPYVEGSIGFTDYDKPYDDSTGFRLLGGYRINVDQKLALSGEIFYTNFGESDIKGYRDATAEVTGFGFGAKASYEIAPKLDLFGRLALISWDVDLENVEGEGLDGRDVIFGFGGEYKFDDHLGFTAAYEMVELDDVDADTIRLGLSYSF